MLVFLTLPLFLDINVTNFAWHPLHQCTEIHTYLQARSLLPGLYQQLLNTSILDTWQVNISTASPKACPEPNSRTASSRIGFLPLLCLSQWGHCSFILQVWNLEIPLTLHSPSLTIGNICQLIYHTSSALSTSLHPNSSSSPKFSLPLSLPGLLQKSLG